MTEALGKGEASPGLNVLLHTRMWILLNYKSGKVNSSEKIKGLQISKGRSRKCKNPETSDSFVV